MIIYTDGSCLVSNPGNAACRIVIEKGGQRDVITKQLGFHSNNYAELAGILMALEHLDKMNTAGEVNEPIQIYSDSRIALGWMINSPREKVLDYTELVEMIGKIHEIKRKFPHLIVSHWSTREKGEIPADFGNKPKRKK
jgi:ribonuclease HI